MSFGVVDLFCGAGGFSLGAAQAGFTPLVGIDIDADLLSAYRLNFPNSKSLQIDVSELDSSAWKTILNGARPCGVIGGPPCQGFSRIGKRARNDARNELIGCFIEQVCSLKPAFFVMENVEGLLDDAFQGILDTALGKARKYFELVGPLKINAASVGVPTERHRVIVIGYDSRRVASLTEKDFAITAPPMSTVKDAISDLPCPNRRDDGEFGWSHYPNGESTRLISSYALQMKQPLPEGLGWPVALQKYRSGEVSGCHKTTHTVEVSRRFAKTRPGMSDKISRYIRLSWAGCCPTLRAGTGAERGSFQAARPLHPEDPRVITVREAARLQGFPDMFVFHRTKWHSFRMIGNSVSPPVAQKVLTVIRDKIKS